MASAMEAKLGWLFEKFQIATYMRKSLTGMGHQQPPTPVAMNNTVAHSIVNGTAKQKISRGIDMRFYWVRDRIRKNHFNILWDEGEKNLE